MLNTRKQLRYTKAERCKGSAELTRHIIRCPFCGKEVPAYSHYLYSNVRATPKRSKSELYKWAQLQTSLFDDSDPTLHLHKPMAPVEKFICTKCERICGYSNKEVELLIENDRSHIYVERSIKHFRDITQMKWLSHITLTDLVGLRERIVFDFESGITHIQLINKSSEILHSSDLTDSYNMTDCSILTLLISENTVVKRKIKNLFQQHWTTPIPFTPQDISIFEFVLMAQFIDFPRNFYDAIPFKKDSYKIEISFMYAANKIHKAADAVDLLMRSEIVHTKSMNKLFFEDPGKLFYLKECKILFGIINDINLFCTLMRSYNTYSILSTLHAYPGILAFYADYCKVKGAKSLCSHLEKHCEYFNTLAVRYCAFSMYERENEQKRWKEDSSYFKDDGYVTPFFIPEFSIPMMSVPESIPNCLIDGFFFKWLRTKREYRNAGRVLKNCLKNWRCDYSTVVTIYKGNNIIAAIEISNKKVYQALKSHNKPIDKDSALFSAIHKWCSRYNIVWHNEEDDEQDY